MLKEGAVTVIQVTDAGVPHQGGDREGWAEGEEWG